MRENVIRHFADGRRRREWNQHPELIHLAREAGADDECLDAVLVEDVGLLQTNAGDWLAFADVDRRHHSARIGIRRDGQESAHDEGGQSRRE